MTAKTFAYHRPSDEGARKCKELREAYGALLEKLTEFCPGSRELSVAITNLETSAMWAVKSIVLNDPNSSRPEG